MEIEKYITYNVRFVVGGNGIRFILPATLIFLLDYDYHVTGGNKYNASASAIVNHTLNKTDVFLHPSKCSTCKEYFPNMEEQMISAINHETQESLVCDILIKEKGFYKNEWFDKTTSKELKDEYTHKCKTKTSTLRTCGYFR